MSTLYPNRENSADWVNHEHLAESAKGNAQRLVADVGSVDLAKHAVEIVGETAENVARTERQRNFCHSLGVDSVEELIGRSTPTPSNDGKRWFETELNDGSWVVWNEDELQADRHFATRDEALTTVPRDDKLSGSSLLG